MKKILLGFILLCLTLSVSAQKSKHLQPEKHYDIFRSLDIYNAIWRELSINYVDTLDYKKLNETAINSMLRSLDPYTIYIPKQNQDDLKTMISGMYGGVGATIQQHGDYVAISSPIYGLPAQKHGLVAGDEIIAIDGEHMYKKSVSEVSEKLRGIPGTEIKLKIKRFGEKKHIEKKFLRESIVMKSVDFFDIIQDSIGYIQLSNFTDKSYEEFKTVIEEFAGKKIKRLIIDLRNNEGGPVNEAVNIASLFVPKNTVIMTTKGNSKQSERKYKTPFYPIMPTIPIVVLINEGTASSAEVLSGALQDLDRAVIVGERSFGKGLVQSIRSLPYDGYLKITTSKYYLPSGRCVQSIDYSMQGERNRDVPDSLTSSFKTSKGREVKDKSGITPDLLVKDKAGNYISYYLFVDNVFFDFATEYYYSHKTIADAKSFAISDSDYDRFIAFVKQKGFSYQLESEKMLLRLTNLIDSEGYSKRTDSTINVLKTILKPDLDKDLKEFRPDIEQYIESEIVKRYYYQKGVNQYMIKHDIWIEEAVKAFDSKILL